VGGEIKGAFLKNKGNGGNVEKSFASILGKIHTGLNKRKKKRRFLETKWLPNMICTLVQLCVLGFKFF